MYRRVDKNLFAAHASNGKFRFMFIASTKPIKVDVNSVKGHQNVHVLKCIQLLETAFVTTIAYAGKYSHSRLTIAKRK